MFSLKRIARNCVPTNKHTRMISCVPPAAVDAFFAKHKETVIPVDASWYMPNVPMNGYHEFMKQRFGNAIFFDVDGIKDHSSEYPHMLPSLQDFEKSVQQLGVRNDSVLLFYDQQGIFSLCRAAWMFEVFGHDLNKMFILNTYTAYNKSHGDPNLTMVIHEIKTRIDKNMVTQPSPLPQSDYKASFDPKKVVSYEQLLELVKEDKIGSEYTLVDARSNGRFTGADPEPRPGLSSGHVKNAVNIPFTDLLTPEKSFLSSMSLSNIFKRKGIDDAKPIIVMCGTGVTACVVRCAMQLAGLKSDNIAVYDGSWTEWASRAPSDLITKDV